MCSLILLCLFSLYTNDLLKYKNRVIENILCINLVSFMKKNFIDKEKSGTVTKVELQKFKKHIYNSFMLELWH